MFAFDAHALARAVAACDAGFAMQLHPIEAAFLYLPFEHAEDLLDRIADWRGRVLDLGCGTGIHTRAVAELADWVVGIDVSPRLVRKAHVKLRGARGSVVVADARHMPFADCVFDSALSYGEPLSHIEDPGAVLAEEVCAFLADPNVDSVAT